jgi:hypothetical protein
VNLDFDWKRRILNAADIGEVISGDTEPWETIDQFHAERDELERWKKSELRVEKTVADLDDRRQWARLLAGQRASGSTRQSGRPPLVNAVMRAIARNQLGVPPRPYHQWASLFTQLGSSVSAQTFKDAARRGRLEMGKLIDLTTIEQSFAESLVRTCPAIEIVQLAQTGSRAWNLLTEICRKTVEKAARTEDLEGLAAGPVQRVPVAGCLPPYSKAPPCAGRVPEITKSADPVYKGGAPVDEVFKDIDRGHMVIAPGQMPLNTHSQEVPPSRAPAHEMLPAASLPVVCRAARATKVLPWSAAHRLLKLMPRMTAHERTRLIVELMDKMLAAVGAEAMVRAMRAVSEPSGSSAIVNFG